MLRVGGGKGVNKNEFTRTQSSYIYNNYGHKAFTWSLQTDDKFLKKSPVENACHGRKFNGLLEVHLP